MKPFESNLFSVIFSNRPTHTTTQEVACDKVKSIAQKGKFASKWAHSLY